MCFIISKKIKTYILITLFSIFLYNCTANKESDNRNTHNFNKDWKFSKEDNLNPNKNAYQITFDDNTWKEVNLPHTAHIEPSVIKKQQWQGVCWYRKTFTIDIQEKKKHLALYFEGAMQIAEVWLNGKKIAKHLGGYLPFYLDITDLVSFSKNNILAVKLNNKDNPQVPPGKPMEGLDFNWYSGLYRNVKLIIKNKTHITNAIQFNEIAKGGVFIRTKKANKKEADILIKSSIFNQNESKEHLKIRTSIYSPKKELIITKTSNKQEIATHNTGVFKTEIHIKTPNLWSPENPDLYYCKVELLKGKKVIDTKETTFGIRSIKFNKEGFYLNNKKYALRGTNRHQEYPYIGYALSDAAQYRDAYKIKQAGFNFVRLSHYPHAEAFMDACDELGILVMDAIPGWQFFGDKVFQENCYNDIRKLVRRDRNHPSVILWESSLNESGMTEDFMNKAHAIVHEEFPGEQVYTCGWIDYAYDVYIPARQHAKAPDYWKKYSKNKPLLIAEYGDWEYYAHNAGFNQTSFKGLKAHERTSRQLRGDGQKRLTQQALNYQESHNDNLYNIAAGDANWLMFDYNRGYAPDIESSGIMDIFRLPKFAYYFYSSQKDFNIKNPVLFIANYWNDSTFNDVKIYSNADEVELWLNNKLIERRKPDTDAYSTNLKHPPFSFKAVPYEKGKLTAKAFSKGKIVAEISRVSPEKAHHTKVIIDTANTPLQTNANDIAFVYAKILDKNNNYVPTANSKVHFKIVKGDAELIGTNSVQAEAGIATILVKINTEKDIKIEASIEE